MLRQQCFSCYDHVLFQLYGQTKDYNPVKIAQDYVKWLEAYNRVSCVVCGREIEYKRNEDGIWVEHEIKKEP
jgi:ribosomal protein L37AE/L43A